MNSNNYKQYDTRWASLPYPRKPWLIRNCGCGEVSICNAIIEMASHQNETPKTIQPYMKQYAESRGNGTYHYGIPAAMKHYGLTEVSEHSTMQKLFAELAKGERVAILLMGKRSAGSKGVHWTGCGHFVAVIQYKKEGGKNWVYVKDSASTSSLRNGWITYEGNIRGACLKCWSGKLSGKAASTTTPAPTVTATPDGKLTIDGIGGPSTVKAMQRYFGTTQDGVISGQDQGLAKWYPALKAVKYGKGGSACVRNLQRWLGIDIDGVWGKKTSIALQSKLGVAADGIFGAGSMKAWQKFLNDHDKDKATYPTVPAKTPSTSTSTSIGAAKIVAKAKAYAWPYGTAQKKWKYSSGSALSGYKSALKKYLKHSTKIAQSDCGYFVTTCVRACGVSSSFLCLRGAKENFPSVPSSMKIVHKGKSIPAGLLQPGDIIRYKKTSGSQHTMIYISNGRVAEAGRKIRFPVIQKDTKKYNASNVKKSTIQVLRAK